MRLTGEVAPPTAGYKYMPLRQKDIERCKEREADALKEFLSKRTKQESLTLEDDISR